MGDHDVIANFDREQDGSLRVCYQLAERFAFGAENLRQTPGEIGKSYRRRQQNIEPGISQQRDGSGQSPSVRPARPV
jgi:hypothetical protein